MICIQINNFCFFKTKDSFVFFNAETFLTEYICMLFVCHTEMY